MDLRLDLILVQQYVILYKLCTEKWLLCLLAWLLDRGSMVERLSMQMQIVAVDLLQLPSKFYSDMERLMGVKNDLIDITDEKTNGIIYKTFDTPTSLFFAKTPVHSAEHKELFRIFADLFSRIPRSTAKTANVTERTVSISGYVYRCTNLHGSESPYCCSLLSLHTYVLCSTSWRDVLFIYTLYGNIAWQTPTLKWTVYSWMKECPSFHVCRYRKKCHWCSFGLCLCFVESSASYKKPRTEALCCVLWTIKQIC